MIEPEDPQPTKNDQASAGLNSDRPYQLNKGSFEEAGLSPKSLKDLIFNYTVTYIIIFVPLFLMVSIFFKQIDVYFNLASKTYPTSVWLIVLWTASLPISFISYYLCLKKTPKDDEYKKLSDRLKLYVIVTTFIFPFVIPYILYGLWILGPMFL